jgi:hypothetical protein
VCKILLGRHDYSWEDAIEMCTSEIRDEAVDWIRLARDGISSLAKPFCFLFWLFLFVGRLFSHGLWTAYENYGKR